VLDKLNPAAGKQAPAGAKGKDKAGKKAKRALKKRPQRLQSL
jgi:hypothetical protein